MPSPHPDAACDEDGQVLRRECKEHQLDVSRRCPQKVRASGLLPLLRAKPPDADTFTSQLGDARVHGPGRPVLRHPHQPSVATERNDLRVESSGAELRNIDRHEHLASIDPPQRPAQPYKTLVE